MSPPTSEALGNARWVQTLGFRNHDPGLVVPERVSRELDLGVAGEPAAERPGDMDSRASETCLIVHQRLPTVANP